MYPLLPVPLEGFIRWAVANWIFTSDTFSAATLAMSAGLMSVFVNQSLRTQEDILPDKEDSDRRNGTCTFFMTMAIYFFVFFGLVVLLSSLVNEKRIDQLTGLLHAFERVVLVTWIVPFATAVVTQRAFKLRASFA
jgi:hypothetical protein